MTIGTLLGLEYKFGDFSFSASAGNLGQRKDENSFSYSPDISVRASWLVPRALVLVSVFNKFNGEQTSFVMNDLAGISERTTGAFNLMDISLSRQFWEKRISLTAGVKNVFGVNSVSSAGAVGIHSGSTDSVSVAWGRTFFASLKFSYNKA
jgi:outer membrane receptor for ferrienterochelin and colicins